MDKYLGPYCQDIDLTIQNIDSDIISPVETGSLTNGVIFELKSYQQKCNLPILQFLRWIQCIEPSFLLVSVDKLRARLNRLAETKKKLEKKKKVKNYASLSVFFQDAFLPTFPTSASIGSSLKHTTIHVKENKPTSNEKDEVSVVDNDLSTSSTTLSTSTITNELNTVESTDARISHVSIQTDSDDIDDILGSPNSNRKHLNLLEYKLSKKAKRIDQFQRKIELNSEKVEHLKARVGYYSVRNVNKREERARKARHLLRATQLNAQYLRRKQTSIINKLKRCRRENERLVLENEKLNAELNQKSKHESSIEKAVHKKLNAQKSASYFKTSSKKLREQLKSDVVNEKIAEHKKIVVEKEKEIQMLQFNQELLEEELKERHSTKNADGSFADNIRLCVIELAGLEVAVEKITPVVQAVSNHVFSRDLKKTDLPTSTSVQSIIDEGHYLAKTFISTKIDHAENWGLNRDGTTRKKKKIVDTSVTLDSGDVISLGFTCVAHETAKIINDVTKYHITELAELNEKCSASSTEHRTPKRNNESADKIQTPKRSISSEFITDTLSKLAFTMSDRASNEKLADKLLDQWRNEILENCDDDQKKSVLHFHCMAHVLLGFHKYAADDLKSLEVTLVEENGPLGRDALPVFKFWSKKGTVIERAVRTTSDTFGPVGDHHGLRDRWEAHCSSKGIKSVIGNYRDNRFNALFQTSAEVFLHCEDILEVIESVRQPNLKLKSVQADLKSTSIRAFLQCFGLVYIKITGPYWNLVTSGRVPYLLLYTHVQDMADFLKSCSSDPALLFNTEGHWTNDNSVEDADVPHRQQYVKKLFVIEEETRDLLYKAIMLVTAAMLRTVEKQLVDFLPGGQFSESPDKDELQRTTYAHTTNLGCEHHFGDLDSSQKRRPNASMHHHSSVQLLKRNRKSLIKWLGDMPSNDRSKLLKTARKGGRVLREVHLNMEKKVIQDIHEEMVNEKNNPRKRRKLNSKSKQEKENDEHEEDEYDISLADLNSYLPVIETFSDNEYVAVAYQDSWYPGCVVKSSGDDAVINFMSPCRKPGYFSWPTRKDEQLVKREFILKRGFVPECVNSGRQWYFPGHVEINVLYEKYQKIFF